MSLICPRKNIEVDDDERGGGVREGVRYGWNAVVALHVELILLPSSSSTVL